MKMFALLAGFALIVLVHAQDQSGFISIDCGSGFSSYKDPSTRINYVSDDMFIETGVNKSVAAGYRVDTNQLPLWDLRSFPEGIRNCYNVKIKKGTKYLIRASFLYGNYDEQGKVPEFNLHLGANLWDSVKLGNESSILLTEIIHTPTSNYVYVCLVNTGAGTPFISALEFRPLKNTTYVTSSGSSLERFARLDLFPVSDHTVRYEEDVHDRMWLPLTLSDWSQINTSLTIDAENQNDFQPPQIVMRSAATPKKANEPLSLVLNMEDSNAKIYVFMHFAELEVLQANQSRQFNISFNGKHLYGPIVPDYLYTTSIYSSSELTGVEGKYEFSIYKTENSTLPPIINAVEFYRVKELFQSETNQVDVDAIKNIKSMYERENNWEGDPCAPQAYMWDGLNCSFDGYRPPRIISLNLSSSGLTGEIAPYLSNLTKIQYLDLSNNSLTGSVPEFLSKLTSLKVLNLRGNMFTGSVPVQLIQRSKTGSLSLSLDQNLCSSVSCNNNNKKKKKNNFIVPIAASLAALFILITLLVIFMRHKRRIKQGLAEKVDSISSIPREPLESKNKRFTYAEVSIITDDFSTVLGEGSFGKVYHGYLNDTEVAVKMLSESSSQGYEQFEAEVKLLLSVHHRNLTSLLGYCDEGANIGLIYEYMANGNLKEHLQVDVDSNEDVLSWEGRLRIAMESAQGLEYLHHGCKPPRVHRDVKSANILLNDKFQAKLADFGLARAFPVEGVTHVSTLVAGTFGYLDPEYFRLNRLTEKSDVFSFGVVLLEIITNRPVIAKTHENKHISQWVGSMLEQGDIESIVDQSLDGDYDINSAWKIVEIAMFCVSSTSMRRPTMTDVVIELKKCLAMEIARKEGHHKAAASDHQEMITVNLSTELTPLAR